MADKKLTNEEIQALPLEEKVKYHYQHGQGSIQDIARVYRMTVNEVLVIIGEQAISTVTTEGDQVDASYAGPGAVMNHGQTFETPFNLD